VKGTVRIIAGLMKGKVIPFNSGKFNNAEITPQKVKGALFSIVGENLRGKTFVDLFAGSGQIGIEALSRDCSLAVFNEKDRPRFEFIKNFIIQSGNSDRSVVLNLDAKAALKYLSGRGIRADIVFLDPPYNREKGATCSYDPIMDDINKSGIITENTEIIIQHFSANELPELCGNFRKTGIKKYGSTSLSIYYLT